jgi:hypothetical protein
MIYVINNIYVINKISRIYAINMTSFRYVRSTIFARSNRLANQIADHMIEHLLVPILATSDRTEMIHSSLESSQCADSNGSCFIQFGSLDQKLWSLL